MSDRAPLPAPATIDDVAKAAGVSTATVSRALRDHPYVAKATRERVVAAAERLRYVANPHAARLASGVTNTIGLLAPLLTSWYTSEVVAGVEEVCSEHGYDLLIGIADQSAPDRLFHSDARFHQRIDGAILVDVLCGDDGAAALTTLDTPVVVLGEQLTSVSSAWVDNVAGGALAARHLLSLGHRHIGVVRGNSHLEAPWSVPDDRSNGFTAALAHDGVTVDPGLVVDGRFSIQGGRVAMNELLSLTTPPTAVFCMSDEMAFGALQAVRERGLVAGSDISIIGFDDHPVSESVGLTTVRQRVRQIGRLGAQTMIAMLNGKTATVHHEVELMLVARSSTGPVR